MVGSKCSENCQGMLTDQVGTNAVSSFTHSGVMAVEPPIRDPPR